ncbi:MAG: hypothetical protein ABSD10_03340 [Candidatus Saccharimonadales bacterium]|jgi:hypothetical protein
MPEPESDPHTPQYTPQAELQQDSEEVQAPIQEAPGAVKLRAEARECFHEISRELIAAQQSGPLTEEEIATFAGRYALEVQGRLDLADQLNSKRRAFLAQQAAPAGTFIEKGVVTGIEEAHRQGLHPELEAPTQL